MTNTPSSASPLPITAAVNRPWHCVQFGRASIAPPKWPSILPRFAEMTELNVEECDSVNFEGSIFFVMLGDGAVGRLEFKRGMDSSGQVRESQSPLAPVRYGISKCNNCSRFLLPAPQILLFITSELSIYC